LVGSRVIFKNLFEKRFFVDGSTLLGLAAFVVCLILAVGLYALDMYKRIDLTLPFGSTIPYTLAMVGAGAFFLAKEGVIGLAGAVASAIFIGAVVKGVKTLRTNPEQRN
jgi:hypothetical protein